MFDLRELSLLQDTFRLSVSVFQSLGLSPRVSEMEPNETFVTSRGPQTPGSVRRSFSQR
jgi:hypothetical protein